MLLIRQCRSKIRHTCTLALASTRMASAAGAAAYGVAAGAGAAARTPARAMVAVQAVERMTSSTSFSIMHWYDWQVVWPSLSTPYSLPFTRNVLADGLAQSGNFLTPDGHKVRTRTPMQNCMLYLYSTQHVTSRPPLRSSPSERSSSARVGIQATVH